MGMRLRFMFRLVGQIYRRGSHEADLSTQQSKAQQKVWIPGADEDPGRTGSIKAAPGKGPGKAIGF